MHARRVTTTWLSRHSRTAGAVLVVAALAGCDETLTRPPDLAPRPVHAVTVDIPLDSMFGETHPFGLMHTAAGAIAHVARQRGWGGARLIRRCTGGPCLTATRLGIRDHLLVGVEMTAALYFKGGYKPVPPSQPYSPGHRYPTGVLHVTITGAYDDSLEFAPRRVKQPTCDAWPRDGTQVPVASGIADSVAMPARLYPPIRHGVSSREFSDTPHEFVERSLADLAHYIKACVTREAATRGDCIPSRELTTQFSTP